MTPEPRRDILAGIGALTPAPDAELITLCREFDELERLSLSYRGSEKYNRQEERKEDEFYAQIDLQQAPLVESICRIRATTPSGHTARERSLSTLNDTMEPTAEKTLTALLRDLTGTAPTAALAAG